MTKPISDKLLAQLRWDIEHGRHPLIADLLILLHLLDKAENEVSALQQQVAELKQLCSDFNTEKK